MRLEKLKAYLKKLWFRKEPESKPPSLDDPVLWERWVHENFRKMSDEELIRTFNGQVGIRAFNRLRGLYLKNLRKKILVRNFDSEILFERNEKGAVQSFKLRRKVKLVTGKLVFIADNDG